MKPLEKGQRVRVKSLEAKGEIFYIDQPNYFNHHMHPVQVKLDKPLEDDSYQFEGSWWVRTNIKDLVRLKPKKPKEEVWFDFS